MDKVTSITYISAVSDVSLFSYAMDSGQSNLLFFLIYCINSSTKLFISNLLTISLELSG